MRRRERERARESERERAREREREKNEGGVLAVGVHCSLYNTRTLTEPGDDY